jgi:hypothetical protein
VGQDEHTVHRQDAAAKLTQSYFAAEDGLWLQIPLAAMSPKRPACR